MKIENIILIGCSYVHGHDICYEKFNINPDINFFHTFPSWSVEQVNYFNDVNLAGRLKHQLGCNVINLAMTGISNSIIANTLIQYLNTEGKNFDPSTTLVIVGWTESSRHDYYFNTNFKHPDRLSIATEKTYKYLEIYEKRINATTDDKEKTKAKEQYDRLKLILPISNLYAQNSAMFFANYVNHIQLINYVQLMVERLNFEYLFFNSLPMVPLNPNLIFSETTNDNLIEWEKYYPYSSKDSYWTSWSDELAKDSSLRTNSYHPSELAVRTFAEKLTDFIKNHY